MERRIGQVTHYFKRIGVAVLELSGGLMVGDVVRIQGHTTDFTQRVESMEIEHQKMQSAGPGAEAKSKRVTSPPSTPSPACQPSSLLLSNSNW